MVSARRVVYLLLALSLLAGALTGTQIYYRLSYLWTLLLLGSWLMSKISLRGIQVHRRARFLRSQVGQVFEERYEVRNPGRIPRLWIELRDDSSLPGTSGSHVVTMIGARESRTYLARTRLEERGVFPLGPTVISSGDLFGLFPTERTFLNSETLLVFPMLFQVLEFPNPPGLLPGGEALRRRTAQITSNAAGVREYEPGDPLHRIHWLSTARRNRLMAKEFELDPLADVWLFVDADASVHVSMPLPEEELEMKAVWQRRQKFDLPPSTIEYGVSIASSLARYYLQRGRAVGAVYSNTQIKVLPSDRGGRQLNKILESLAVVQADGEMPLEALVEVQARHLPRGSTAVIITPSTSESVFRTSDVLLRRGLRPVAVLIDGSTFGGKDNPDGIISSLEFLGVPICRVAFNDDLSKVLSNAVSQPNLVKAW
jgi:uncharacterized protein (DUF58 family)